MTYHGDIRMMVRLILLLSLVGLAVAEDAGDPVPQKKEANGIALPPTAAALKAEMDAKANRVTTLLGGMANTEKMTTDMLRANAAELEPVITRETTANVPTTASIESGLLNGAISFQWTRDDNIQVGSEAPELVDFMTATGPNRLKGIDDKMKRASKWINQHTCGGFDWALEFRAMFNVDALKEYVKELGQGVIAAAPMALLGAFAPQLAEIIKHLKMITGMNLNQLKMSCEQIQSSLTKGIQSTSWAASYGECVNNYKGSSLGTVEKECSKPDYMNKLATADDTLTSIANAPAAAMSQWGGGNYNVFNDVFPSAFGGGADKSTSAADAQTKAAQGGTGTGPSGVSQQDPSKAAILQGVGSVAPGTMEMLGGGLTRASKGLLQDFLGSATLAPTGSLVIGRNRGTFKAQLSLFGASQRDDLVNQLNDHFSFISADPVVAANIASSKKKLRIWTWRTRGGSASTPDTSAPPPWKTRGVIKNVGAVEHRLEAGKKRGGMGGITMYDQEGNGVFTGNVVDQKVTDVTMDNLAVLLNWRGMNHTNAAYVSYIDRVYGPHALVDAIARYELCLWFKEYLLNTMETEMKEYISSEASVRNIRKPESITNAVEGAFWKGMEQIDEALTNHEEVILMYLGDVNRYKPTLPWRIQASSVPGPWQKTPSLTPSAETGSN